MSREYIKGDKMMRVITKVFTFIFYKSERKLPSIEIQLMKL
jgi:hypothetical protein